MKKQLLLVALLSAGIVNVKAETDSELLNLTRLLHAKMEAQAKTLVTDGDAMQDAVNEGQYHVAKEVFERELKKSHYTMEDIEKAYNMGTPIRQGIVSPRAAEEAMSIAEKVLRRR